MIVVVGEVCEDIFIYGETNRLSPEAPVPVFLPQYEKTNRGMSGNVVENVLAIKKNTDVIFYHQKKIITKTRFVDKKSNHMFLRVDKGEDTKVDGFYMDDEFIMNAKRSEALIVSDYDKGFLTHAGLCNISSYAPINILDSKKELNENILSKYDFTKLNEIEYKNNQNLVNKFKNKVLITLGSRGVLWNDNLYKSESPKETIDVSGAGDTFIAAFTLKFLETKNIEESINYGNTMAGIVVTKRGVTTP